MKTNRILAVTCVVLIVISFVMNTFLYVHTMIISDDLQKQVDKVTAECHKLVESQR